LSIRGKDIHFTNEPTTQTGSNLIQFADSFTSNGYHGRGGISKSSNNEKEADCAAYKNRREEIENEKVIDPEIIEENIVVDDTLDDYVPYRSYSDSRIFPHDEALYFDSAAGQKSRSSAKSAQKLLKSNLNISYESSIECKTVPSVDERIPGRDNDDNNTYRVGSVEKTPTDGDGRTSQAGKIPRSLPLKSSSYSRPKSGRLSSDDKILKAKSVTYSVNKESVELGRGPDPEELRSRNTPRVHQQSGLATDDMDVRQSGTEQKVPDRGSLDVHVASSVVIIPSSSINWADRRLSETSLNESVEELLMENDVIHMKKSGGGSIKDSVSRPKEAADSVSSSTLTFSKRAPSAGGDSIASSLHRNSASLEAVLGKDRMERLFQNIQTIDDASPVHPDLGVRDSFVTTRGSGGDASWGDMFDKGSSIIKNSRVGSLLESGSVYDSYDRNSIFRRNGRDVAVVNEDYLNDLELEIHRPSPREFADIVSYPLAGSETRVLTNSTTSLRDEKNPGSFNSARDASHTRSGTGENVRYSYKSDEIYAVAEKLNASGMIQSASVDARPSTSGRGGGRRQDRTVNVPVSKSETFRDMAVGPSFDFTDKQSRGANEREVGLSTDDKVLNHTPQVRYSKEIKHNHGYESTDEERKGKMHISTSELPVEERDGIINRGTERFVQMKSLC